MGEDDLLRRRRNELAELVKSRGIRATGMTDLAADDDGLHAAFSATLLGFDVRHALDVGMELSEIERRAIKAEAMLDLGQARLGAGAAGDADRVSTNQEVDDT